MLWGAPTFAQCRIGFDETYRAAGGVADFNRSRMEVTFPTGGKIFYRSLDNPDNARGLTADGVILDEAGFISERAYYEVVRPMISDTGGWELLMGTPNGRNWFWREHQAARLRSDSEAWQVPTLGVEIVAGKLRRKPHPLENPEFSFEEAERMFSVMPQRVFEQEFLAVFLENEGAVFRNIVACMNAPRDATPDQHKGHHLCMGVDWGKQADFTAMSVICRDCRQEVAHDRFNQIDYVYQVERLKAVAEYWGVRVILAESNAMGEPVIEQLQRAGMPVRPFQTTATSKPPLIESLALAFEREELQWLADPVWTGELEAYERKVSPVTGRSQYSAPEGMHDDTVMARALAHQAMQQPPAWDLAAFV